MSLNKVKKAIKLRGHHTHGYGSKKKHRGSGHQGGVGMAGTGKRADQKKPSIWRDLKYFGKHGFISKSSLKIKTLNLFYIEDHFDDLVKAGKIKKEGELYVVKISDFKCNKLLGSGSVKHKYKILTDYASAKAVEKVQEAKGTVELLKTKKEKKAKKAE